MPARSVGCACRCGTMCPDLPHGLADVIHQALTRDPEKRFADVKAMREALEPFRA